MARLIDAEALLQMGSAKKIIEVIGNWDELSLKAKSACVRLGVAHKRLILNAPTVDAVPVVHGRWKKHKPDSSGYANGFVCSCCGDTVYTDYSMKECVYNYCPNCGAKMNLEDE